jgi:hypothetical protein
MASEVDLPDTEACKLQPEALWRSRRIAFFWVFSAFLNQNKQPAKFAAPGKNCCASPAPNSSEFGSKISSKIIILNGLGPHSYAFLCLALKLPKSMPWVEL